MALLRRICAPITLSVILSLAATGIGGAQTPVLTQHDDNARTGAYTGETTLTPANVNTASFGKLFTLPLDANVNGQVLYVPGVTVNGAAHNVVYAFTSNNSNGSSSSLYAFDADSGALLWRHQLTNSAQWTTDTPVIDPTTSTIYMVTKDNDDNGNNNLRALDIRTGAEKPGSPIAIRASAAGSGDGSVNNVVTLTNSHANCRPGLLLVGGNVYIAFAHNSDSFPYQGWVLGYHYDGTKFTQTAVFCTAPNGGDAGIWMAGKGLAADNSGSIYAAIGNGTFDANSGGHDYGMSYVKLSTPGLAVTDWFTPFDEQSNSDADLDINNSGLAGIPGTTRLFGGATKFGSAFLLDSTNMGHFTAGGPDKALNRLDNLTPNDSVGQNPVAWDSGTYKYVYLWANGANLQQFRYDPSVGKLNPAAVFAQVSSTTGGELALSSNGTANGILWAAAFNGVLHAYNAASVSGGDLWNSSQNSSRDSLGSVGHFQFPTVANGRVYVPTGSASVAVYGLLQQTQTTLSTTADSIIRAGVLSNYNYGAGTQLISRKNSNDSTNFLNFNTYLKFDLTAVKTAPSKAVLQMTVLSASVPASGVENVQIYGVASTTWTDSGITWNNAPGLNRTNNTSTGTLIITQNVPLTPGVVTFDVTSYVRANIGKAITLQMMDSRVQNLHLVFNSEKAASGRPVLVLTK